MLVVSRRNDMNMIASRPVLWPRHCCMRLAGLGVWILMLFMLGVAGQPRAWAESYSNFQAAVYVPVNILMRFDEDRLLEREWAEITAQLKIGKVYLEVQRDRTLANTQILTRAKAFFAGRNVNTAGGMALSDGSIGGQFKTFCYTKHADREFISRAVQLAAQHFDEIIQDDFFFVSTKHDSDIIAKGRRSWTEFRLDLMRNATRELILQPARQVNPQVRMIIKYPNWYEHFQGLGYDLEIQPWLFDGIYTGTETRDPELTDQNLQEYQSYLIFRYLENVAPGRNLGGWVDTYSIRHIDRYAEQLWATLFAKAPEITLFEWSALVRPAELGDRQQWAHLPTSLNLYTLAEAHSINNSPPQLTYAAVAGFCLAQADAVLGYLGNPIGIKSYRPHHSWGEDFLHNYFGNLGIPIDLCPEYPSNAPVLILTEAAATDPLIVQKMQGSLRTGAIVVITSGLLRALQNRGIEQIAEIRYTDRKILAREFVLGYGPGAGTKLCTTLDQPILLPDVRFLTNDSWPVVRALADGRGYPLMLLNRYSAGTLYVWVIPDNPNDLYRIPPAVIAAIKAQFMHRFPVRIDSPAKIALYVYDNGTFVLQSFRDVTSNVQLTVDGRVPQLKILPTGRVILPSHTNHSRLPGTSTSESTTTVFALEVFPHSYVALSVDELTLTNWSAWATRR